jgi:hypothetical protein
MNPGNPIHYLYFRLKARSKFDLHSPFVYRLYSKVLQDRSWYDEYAEIDPGSGYGHLLKYYRLIFRLSGFFQPETILVGETKDFPVRLFGYPKHPEGKLIHRFKETDADADLFFIDLIETKPGADGNFSRLLQHIQPGTVLVLWNLRKSMETLASWDKLKVLAGVSVTIDLFRIGLIFFRKELSREDYLIRF